MVRGRLLTAHHLLLEHEVLDGLSASGECMSLVGRRGSGEGSDAVYFKRTEHKDTWTYHIYGGPSRQAALEYLRRTPVRDGYVYTIVETPEGNFGRDLVYLFRESDGALIELGKRPQAECPSPSSTRCAWCSFFVAPFSIPITERYMAEVHWHPDDTDAAEMIHNGAGLRCPKCALLQCAVCSGLAKYAARKVRIPFSDPGANIIPLCRACGARLELHSKLGLAGRSTAPSRPDADQMVTLPADPLGDEMWGRAPLRVPWNIDVARFFEQDPLPYMWPQDGDYMSHIDYLSRLGESYLKMLLRSSWINVFLHHPNPDVNLGCLRSAPPEGSEEMASLADLLASATAESHVKEEAVRVFWGLDDFYITFILNVLLSRDLAPSGYSTNQVHQAISKLRTACPEERRAWFDEQLTQPEED
ncbi:hypothetical protein SRB5_15500 [Streptomyces sp. RB5]|uniref:Uncharacterized protein n=1 Tax=Streptomyces smaragdinus TaxID=2585196 RepID=A0A7K0CEF5_9ACTN|nr:hypothetical protein [Streptomyces smaragdinus]MQY11432.1 hypothetical protein [Streptomyces smaragdinus]